MRPNPDLFIITAWNGFFQVQEPVQSKFGWILFAIGKNCIFGGCFIWDLFLGLFKFESCLDSSEFCIPSLGYETPVTSTIRRGQAFPRACGICPANYARTTQSYLVIFFYSCVYIFFFSPNTMGDIAWNYKTVFFVFLWCMLVGFYLVI